ncbi:F0F1 ATP synthase subunit B family protein [Terriglobus tenax]|uniref:F0F1 ATP synthase subunit B family protein n=1 Tax=Terriglobus tenax TaxID=1111115 RepID=UPI0021E0B98E|nr:ATPase [Terriglobus tenax]
MKLKKIMFVAMLAGVLAVPAPLTFAQESAPAATQGVPRTAPEDQKSEKKEVENENDAFLKSPMVVKLGHALGMEPETAATVFQVLNFAILAIAVLYGLMKALPKAFRKRSEDIGRQLNEARSATEAANARMSAVEARLAKLDGELSALRSQAAAEAAAEEARLRAQLEDEKHKIVAAAEQEIAAASSHAQRAIKEFAADLAISQAAQKLQVTAETDRLLIRSFAERLGGSNGGQN